MWLYIGNTRGYDSSIVVPSLERAAYTSINMHWLQNSTRHNPEACTIESLAVVLLSDLTDLLGKKDLHRQRLSL